jgi:hypothetical protein
VVRLLDKDLERAQRSFAHYVRGMRRHVKIEEQVLFQMVAFERTGEARLPRQAIEADHVEILRLVDEMAACLGKLDLPGFRARHERLAAVLAEHAELAERSISPAFEALVGPAETQRIVDGLRSL